MPFLFKHTAPSLLQKKCPEMQFGRWGSRVEVSYENHFSRQIASFYRWKNRLVEHKGWCDRAPTKQPFWQKSRCKFSFKVFFKRNLGICMCVYFLFLFLIHKLRDHRINSLWTYNSISVNTCIDLYNCHGQDTEQLCDSKNFPHASSLSSNSSSIPILAKSWSVPYSYGLVFNRISQKWNHTGCNLYSCLQSVFSQSVKLLFFLFSYKN